MPDPLSIGGRRDPFPLYRSRKTLSADGTGADGAIVGSSANCLAHADGVTLVAGVTDKIIIPVAIVIEYIFATAAYTAGGTIGAKILQSGTDCTVTGTVAAATGFGAALNARFVLFPLTNSSVAATTLSQPLALFASGAFTQPGTAAGTATIDAYYRILDHNL